MSSFHPPRRLLMGPGPSDVSPRVSAALARPTIGHMDPAFIGLMDQVKDLLQYAFQTKNALTMPISAPGSAGMEACFVNLLEPGDSAIICVNGVFGNRMKENAERCGARVAVVEDAWGAPVDPEKLRAALAANPTTKLVAFVHAETSTGIASDAAALCAAAQEYGALSVVDCVTSLGGVPVLVDEWGADAVYSGTQKCLSCVPGLSPVTFSPRAIAAIRARKTKCASWFLDMSLLLNYWDGGAKRAYHHTAPVNSIYALHESLLMLREEGLQTAWDRHALHHRALRDGLNAMGLSLPTPESSRLPQLNAVSVPPGIDEAALRATLLTRWGLEIGAGLGPLAGKIWRIGLMGQSCTALHVLTCLTALETALGESQIAIKPGAALSAAERVLFG